MQSEPNTAQTPFRIDVADRVKRLPPYLFGKINALKYQKRRAGVDVIDLGMGNPTDVPDPLVIEKLCELHARNRGFTTAFISAFPHAVDLAAGREHALASLAELARRAKESGQLRPDFVLDDLILMFMASSGIRAASPAAAVAASRRFAALAIQAFQAAAQAAPLPPVPQLALPALIA